MSNTKSALPGLPGFDQDNLQPWTVQVVASMSVLAAVFVGLRILSRKLKSQPLWWDDKMIIFSMGWNLLVVGFIFAMYSAGMGIHADKVEPSSIVMMAKWLVVAEVLYAWNLGWTKMALLLMYYRIFRLPYFKRMAWAVGGFVWAWVVCITFLFIFICVPVQKLWYPHLPGRCIDQVGTWISNALSTILTDLIILLMPIPQIWKLQLRKTEKIGLTLAFGLGLFVVCASAYRTRVLFTYTSTDPTYTLAPTVGWTAIEMSAGIVSACLPTCLPIVLIALRACGLVKPLSASRPSNDNSNTPPTIGGSGGPSNNNSSSTKALRRSSKNARSSTTGRHLHSTTGQDDCEQGSPDGAFYRLPDKTESDGESISANTSDEYPPQHGLSVREFPDSELRPDMKGYERSLQGFKSSDGDGLEDKDGIPMRSILVRKEFTHSSRRK